MLALLLSSLIVPTALAADDGGGDVVATNIRVIETGDAIVIKADVQNQGTSWVPSFTVRAYGTKSGLWEFCSAYSMAVDQDNVDALDVGESKTVKLVLPEFFDSVPGDLYLVIDADNHAIEAHELYNTTIIEVKERAWFGDSYSTGWAKQPTPDCVLDDIDPIFEFLDNFKKPFVVAEVLQ